MGLKHPFLTWEVQLIDWEFLHFQTLAFVEVSTNDSLGSNIGMIAKLGNKYP